MFLSCSFAQSVSSKFRSIKFDEVRVPRKYNGTEPCIRFLVTRYPRKTPKLVLMRQQKKKWKKVTNPWTQAPNREKRMRFAICMRQELEFFRAIDIQTFRENHWKSSYVTKNYVCGQKTKNRFPISLPGIDLSFVKQQQQKTRSQRKKKIK